MSKFLMNLFIWVLLVSMYVLIIYNCIFNENFYTVNIAQMLTLIVSVGIAFIASQYKNDERRCKDHIINLISIVQNIINSPEFVCAESDIKSTTITSNNRKLKNTLRVLKGYSVHFAFKDELKYIQDMFEQYEAFVGEHINDNEYLSKSNDQLKRYSSLIDDKCNSIVCNLYTY